MIILGGLIVAAAIFIGILIWNAPTGYEDEKGFHYGNPPQE